MHDIRMFLPVCTDLRCITVDKRAGNSETLTAVSNPKRSFLAAKVLLDGDIENAADLLF